MVAAPQTGPAFGPPIYTDPDQPIEARVADLVARMTPEEKISQMVHDAQAVERKAREAPPAGADPQPLHDHQEQTSLHEVPERTLARHAVLAPPHEGPDAVVGS